MAGQTQLPEDALANLQDAIAVEPVAGVRATRTTSLDLTNRTAPVKQGLYDPANEHDACGVGFIADMKNKASHQIIKDGLFMLENLTHRGAVGADPLMGDGAGILVQLPHRFFKKEMPKQGIDAARSRQICGRPVLHAAG